LQLMVHQIVYVLIHIHVQFDNKIQQHLMFSVSYVIKTPLHMLAVLFAIYMRGEGAKPNVL
jgi:hypothetical protein